MKTCSMCKQEKSLDNFVFIRHNKNSSALYRARCTPCYNYHYREKHRARPLNERLQVYVERKSKTTFHSRKEDRIKRLFGISLQQFNDMLEEQKGCCYICQTHFDHEKEVNIDHDHSTGKLRKLLCRPCNTSLGLLKEKIETFYACAEYLKEHNDYI